MDTKDINFHSQVPGNGILAGLDLKCPRPPSRVRRSGALPPPSTTQLILGRILVMTLTTNCIKNKITVCIIIACQSMYAHD
jgi:hypothetical protein